MSSKKSRRQAGRQRERRASRTKAGAIALAVAVVVGVGGWFAWQQATRAGQSIESMGRAHVPAGTPGPVYNTSPPTSGPHADATSWGEHFSPIPHVNQVHNLEHGGVLIQYNCEHEALRTGCGRVQQELREVMQSAREDIDPKIILAPYPDMDEPIALTAWTRLEYLGGPDREAILAFIRGNINHAPEQVE